MWEARVPHEVEERSYVNVEQSWSILSQLLEHKNCGIASGFMACILQPLEGTLDLKLDDKNGCESAASLSQTTKRLSGHGHDSRIVRLEA